MRDGATELSVVSVVSVVSVSPMLSNISIISNPSSQRFDNITNKRMLYLKPSDPNTTVPNNKERRDGNKTG